MQKDPSAASSISDVAYISISHNVCNLFLYMICKVIPSNTITCKISILTLLFIRGMCNFLKRLEDF